VPEYTFMPPIRAIITPVLARYRQIGKVALALLIALVALATGSDTNIGQAKGPYDWHQRVIVLLPGVCAQPAALPPAPHLPSLPLLPPPPSHWPTWPGWLICGGAHAPQNARARALGTFAGSYTGPAQLSAALDSTLQSSLDDNASNQGIPFTIRAIEAFSYAGNKLTYASSQTRQPIAVSAHALDAQFHRWQRAYPRATFDLIGHSLGGAVAAYWAAAVASPGELRAIHSIITLDSPLGGFPRSLADSFFTPFFGPVAQDLLAGSPVIAAISRAPGRWGDGPGTLANPIVTITNVRDLVVPFFLATIPGAVLVAGDYGPDSSSLNHGSILTSPAALAQVAQALAQEGMPLLSQASEYYQARLQS
jgi:pimeloyl-ACP methyl ester carboxylesterase